MTTKQKIMTDEALSNESLDLETLELLGRCPSSASVPQQELAKIRADVMARIDEEESAATPYVTIREDEGAWIELEPFMEKKVLSVNRETGIETILLRLHPGVSPERHFHAEDEMCVVLEGDVSFDDVSLKAGDYHFARKGSWHGPASTVHGALLFLQSAIAPAPAIA